MPVSRTVLAAGSLIAAIAAAGCSAGVTNSAAPSSTSPSAAPSTAASTTPGGTSVVVPTVVVPSVTISGLPGTGSGGGTGSGVGTGSGGETVGKLPVGFPLPPGATVTRVQSDSGETAATLTVPDPGQATTFWKSALPAAGYAVISAQTAGGFGEIRFSGHGCVGNSQLAIQGTSVALQCNRG